MFWLGFGLGVICGAVGLFALLFAVFADWGIEPPEDVGGSR